MRLKILKYILPLLCIIFMSFVTYEKLNSNSSFSNPKAPQEFLTDYYGDTISKDFKVRIVDTSEKPIYGVEVKIGDKTVTTDSSGFYEIEDAKVNEAFSSVTISREGYIDNSIDITSSEKLEHENITIKKNHEVCLFWFCRYH